MNAFIDIVKWVAVFAGTALFVGGLIVGTLSWFLTHPD